MKNNVPIILSVLLGLAAVFAVNRLSSQRDNQPALATVSIAVATCDIPAQTELTEALLTFAEVPAQAIPPNALHWQNVSVAYGQRVQRALSSGDFLLLSDIKAPLRLAECAREGEWTVPVTFADASLVPMLSPDDEIAILATYDDPTAERRAAEKVKGSATNLLDLAELAKTSITAAQRVTVVLLPRVKVLGLGGQGANFREKSPDSSSGATIFVSLPPQQAILLVAAQQIAELHPVLRRANDETAIARTDGGIITEDTFGKLREKLAPIELPNQPGK